MASDSGIQAPSDGGDVASQIQFHDLCALMEKIHKTQGTDKKKTILSSFIERWRETHARLGIFLVWVPSLVFIATTRIRGFL